MYVKNISGEKQMPFHRLSVGGTDVYKNLGVPRYNNAQQDRVAGSFTFFVFLRALSAFSVSRDFW